MRYYPQPLVAFSDLTGKVVLQFLVAYPAPTEITDLTLDQLTALCRQYRYYRWDRLPAIAGTCPITVASGRYRSVRFRRACNRQHRQTAQQFAQSSTRQSIWAATYFSQACARSHTKSHAYRCLANRWLHIIWTLWQTRQPYDEAYHLRQVARHRRPVSL